MASKMIRDKVLQEIVASGKDCVIHTCKSVSEYNNWIVKKLAEELVEFMEEPSVEEAADIYEAFLGLLYKHNISLTDVRRAAATKREELGGFKNGTVLHNVIQASPQENIA